MRSLPSGAVQVDFEEGYAIEGAKEVATVATRHVTRLLRPWLAAHSDRCSLRVHVIAPHRFLRCCVSSRMTQCRFGCMRQACFVLPAM